MKQIAVLGHGVVGSGIMEVLEKNRVQVEEKAGCGVEVRYVLDRRAFPGLPYSDRFVTDFSVILEDPEVEVVAEAMGGLEPAFTYARESLSRGKSFVTSNKELVAAKGDVLLALAREKGVRFLFEASVGGGIPVIEPIHRSLGPNRIQQVAGILNGTTNFILTKMLREGTSFQDALELAQRLGYAERDPSADVEGHDACRKICILAALAFGRHFYPEDVPTRGITGVTARDAAYAARWGGSIKLIGRARRGSGGRVALEVSPMLVPGSSLLSGVGDVYNAVQVTGDMTGDVLFYGRGAGKLPTAAAVVGDIAAALREPGNDCSLFWGPADPAMLLPPEEAPSQGYFRVSGLDREELELFFPGAFFLESLEEGEEALITPPATQGELDAAARAAEAAGGRILSRFPLL
jgi:homoserine dehydrogenase